MMTSKLNFRLVTACCFLYSTVFTLLVPQATTISSLLVIVATNQFAHGAFVAGLMTYYFTLWGKEAAPFVQANMFMFSTGAVISPLIASPFLMKQGSNQINVPGSLFWPFAILSGYQFLCTILAFAAYLLSPIIERHPSQEADRGREASGDKCDAHNIWKLLVFVLVILLMHSYMGVMTCLSSFLTTFTVKSDVRMSTAAGAHLTSLYWFMSSVVRLFGIFYIKRIGPEKNLFLCTGVVVMSNLFLFPFGDSDVLMLVIGVSVAGMGMSTITGSLYAFLEEYIPVTPRISACINVAAYTGEFTFPYIFSDWIEQQPRIVLWVVLSCSMTMLIAFSLMSLTCRLKLKK